MSSRVYAVVSFIVSDFVGSVLRFPLWWYTDGLLSLVRWLVQLWQYRRRGYALGLWLRNFFVPMYGAYDWAGRLISVGMRTVVILARLFALFVEGVVFALLVFAWCFVPILCMVFLLLNVSAGLEAWVRPL